MKRIIFVFSFIIFTMTFLFGCGNANDDNTNASLGNNTVSSSVSSMKDEAESAVSDVNSGYNILTNNLP